MAGRLTGADRLLGRHRARLLRACASAVRRACFNRANALLADEIDEQILPDGGHASRNPRVLIDLLTDLLPLRQIYAARGSRRRPRSSAPSTA